MPYSYNKEYSDPILFNAKDIPQTETGDQHKIIDICVLHLNSIKARTPLYTLKIDYSYMPDIYKNFDKKKLINLDINLDDPDNENLSYIKYTLKWNVFYKSFSTGVIKIDYLDENEKVVDSIHVIIYDSLPNPQLDFHKEKETVEKDALFEFYDNTNLFFNPKIYSYFMPMSDLKYGYDVLLENENLNISKIFKFNFYNII